MSRLLISRFRYLALLGGIAVAFSVVLGRLAYLHIYEQERLGRIVERNRQKFEVLQACRGSIRDARGNLLATTREVIELGVDPQVLEEEHFDKLPQLAKILNLPLEEVRASALKKTIMVEGPDGEEIRLVRWQKLADAIDEPTYEKILKLGIKGIYGNRKFERWYPGGSLAAHALGFVNKEGVPSGGIEAYMDFYLRGQNGWRESENDGRRREVAHLRSREVKANHGLHVELSIDVMVQHMVEQALTKVIEEYQPDNATVIVSDPVTGFLIGLANYPTFDLNRFFEAPLDAHRNRAITDLFEPGSTFKIVPAAGVLTEQLVDLNEIIDCSINKVEYRGRMVSLPKDHRPMGLLSAEDVIARSSNRGAVHLAMRLGSERLYDYAKAFGFGEFTGFGPVGEVKGVLHPVSKWDVLTISRLPMGHAVAATPMQVHYAMSVIANQGILMEPQIVQRVCDDQGKAIANFSPKPKRRVIRTDVAHTVSDLLVKVVENGTLARAKVNGFEVAGKSGTTQKIIDGKYSQSHHVASCSGFFPASRPQFVITVVVDNPKVKGTGWGSLVAAPVFKAVAESLIKYYAMVPPSQDKNLIALKEKHHDRIR
jgi:cell division protein FtsI/penicillin-binding protein 2